MAATSRRTARRARRWWLAALISCVMAAGATVALVAARNSPGRPVLRVVATFPLPGDTSRFDYASLDTRRGLLFAAHLGASEVVEISIRTGRVVRTIPGLPQVHGTLVVPALRTVYATATGADVVARISEDTGQILGSTPTGSYPDGLAYDPANGTIWITNEAGGSETIIWDGRGGDFGLVQ